jgi:hypothetical protein
MIVKVCEQFLDNDAEARRLFIGQPLLVGEAARGCQSLTNSVASFEAKGRALRIGFA